MNFKRGDRVVYFNPNIDQSDTWYFRQNSIATVKTGSGPETTCVQFDKEDGDVWPYTRNLKLLNPNSKG